MWAPSEKYPAATKPFSVVWPTATGPRATARTMATRMSTRVSRTATRAFAVKNGNRRSIPTKLTLPTDSLSGVNLFDDVELAVAIFEDVEAADRRVAVWCELEGASDAATSACDSSDI